MNRWVIWSPSILFGASIICFGLFRLLSGDPADGPVANDAPLFLVTMGSVFAGMAVVLFGILIIIRIISKNNDN